MPCREMEGLNKVRLIKDLYVSRSKRSEEISHLDLVVEVEDGVEDDVEGGGDR